MARYDIHRLIQDLTHKPDVMAAFTENRDAVFASYGFTEEEAEHMRAATPADLAALDVHPILQMHYLMLCNPEMGALVSIKPYLTAAKVED